MIAPTTDQLEVARIALGVGLVLSNVAVWYGVLLENDRFPKEVQDKGWRILLVALAIEAALAFILLAADTTISLRQGWEIAAIKTPRSLSTTQQIELTGALKKFAGTPFDFGVAGSQEGVDIMNQIGDALTKAGWKWVDTPNWPSLDEEGEHKVALVVNRGIRVQIAEEKAADWSDAIKGLRDELQRFGLIAEAGIVKRGKEQTNAVHIHIGDKM